MSEWTKGPYREEFGAIYHADERGYLFTVDPPRVASSLADSLNELHRLKNAAPTMAEALEEAESIIDDFAAGVSELEDPKVHAELRSIRAALLLAKGEDRG